MLCCAVHAMPCHAVSRMDVMTAEPKAVLLVTLSFMSSFCSTELGLGRSVPDVLAGCAGCTAICKVLRTLCSAVLADFQCSTLTSATQHVCWVIDNAVLQYHVPSRRSAWCLQQSYAFLYDIRKNCSIGGEGGAFKVLHGQCMASLQFG